MAASRALPEARLVVFGSINVDMACRVASIARPGETVLSPRYEQTFGGKGANQAVAAARLSAGGQRRVAVIGAIGEDAVGAAVGDDLAGEGIDTTALRTVPGEPTGMAFIAVDATGENAITVASGANRMLTADALDVVPLAGGDVLVAQMEVPIAETIAAATRGRAAGARVVANLAPVPGDLDAMTLGRLLEACDWLVVNRAELDAAADLLELSRAPADRRAQALADSRTVHVIATLGADGAVLASPGASRSVQFAAEPVAALDTTGAGDAFVGAFASGLAEGIPPEAAVARANRAAASACRALGARAAMPRRRDLGDEAAASVPTDTGPA